MDTLLTSESVRRFAGSFRGEIVRPGDATYDEARKVWNGMIDKRPALIARCADVGDVVAGVNFARENELVLAARGGGHGVAGTAVCDDGIVVDLSKMKRIEVDAASRTARAQAGLLMSEFDAATHAAGLATTGGMVSDTGLAGLAVGGGIGWLMRKHGLTCDNLLWAEVVTADGQTLTASAEEHPDLFWAIRGGGGNFGIVTEFGFRLHPVSTVLGGMLLYDGAAASAVLRFLQGYLPEIPDELTLLPVLTTAPPALFVPAEAQGKRAVIVAGCYAGPTEAGEKALRPLREFGPPLVDLFAPIPYPALQSMLDATVPAGLQNYWKAGYMEGLSDEAVDTIVSFFESVPSPRTQIHVHHFGGAMGRVSADATAFSRRDTSHGISIISMWEDPSENDRQIDWTRRFHAAMEPVLAAGSYVNFEADASPGKAALIYGPERYRRLAEIKARYDPSNLFHTNHNIRPAAG
jgi:FAD/FMN-containing dehydrogenase